MDQETKLILEGWARLLAHESVGCRGITLASLVAMLDGRTTLDNNDSRFLTIQRIACCQGYNNSAPLPL